MLDRFHTKLHRYNHHTSPTAGFFDSASDPIASPQDPFKGDLHVIGTLSATFLEALSSIRIGGGTNRGQLYTDVLTAFRSYKFPNANGTVLLDSTIAPLISSLSANNASFISSSIIWVDSLSGSDITGLRERADRPFKSLSVAQAAAIAGDLIHVGRGGYTDSGLGATNVDWYFEYGAVVYGVAPSTPVFTYSGLSYNVYGNATFSISGNVVPTTGTGLIADFNGSNGTKDLFFEFRNIVINSSGTINAAPTTAAFKGTFGSKNVHIKGNSIYAPILCAFNGFKTLNAGTQAAVVDISEYIVAQTIFNNSGHRMSTYVTAPIISATDYVFNDGATADALDLFIVEAEEVFGSVLKGTTTGAIYFDVNDWAVTPRTGSTWNTTAAGIVQIEGNSLTTSIPLSTRSISNIALNSFTSTSTASGIGNVLNYGGTLSFKANFVTLTYSTSAYSMFYTNTTSSKLNAKLGDVTNVSLGGYNLVYADSVSASIVKLDADYLIGGADFHLYGTNLKSRLKVRATPNTFIDIDALSASIDSSFVLQGFYKTLSAANVRVTAVSGQSATKVYIDSGSGFQSTGTYTLDLSGVSGTPVELYVIGTTITNKTPLDPAANFNLNCGLFESLSSIVVPVF